jgi:NADH:ubiquinone oxidoreductase subunit F (NADH-binding)
MGAAFGHAQLAAPALGEREVERDSAMNGAASMTDVPRPVRSPQEPGLPRLLAGIPTHGALTLEQHAGVHGSLPSNGGHGRRRERERANMIAETARAGLLGRGGAAFPTATKMQAVLAARRRPIVVANGAEGEPASLKDRTLLESLPHLVLDGGVLAADAIGADEVIVCVCESAQEAIESVALAIAERPSGGSGRGAPALRMTTVPSHYVAGQESALINYLGGAPALPRFTPPMPFEQGVKRRPTLVNNVETLAHLGLIARHGASWFRELGTPTQPGSALVTLSGAIGHPGVYEIEHGASLSSLISAAGGATARLRGALVGGYAGTWIAGELLGGVALSNEHLAAHGAALGAGVVLLLSEEACPVAENARLARWLADQSAHQCGPCVHGLDALARTLEEIAGGIAGAEVTHRIDRLASLVSGRGACGHPDGALNPILSALRSFQSEFAEHARYGPCEACSRAGELPLPDWPIDRTTMRTARGQR